VLDVAEEMAVVEAKGNVAEETAAAKTVPAIHPAEEQEVKEESKDPPRHHKTAATAPADLGKARCRSLKLEIRPE
jgi:hypothetical protein